MAVKQKESPIAKMLSKIFGLEVEKAETFEEAEAVERHKNIIKSWEWVRYGVDKGAKEYLETGNAATLQEFTSPSLCTALCAHLDQLRAQGIFWSQPERKTRTTPRIEFVSEKLNRQNQPTEFTVRERFADYSLYRSATGEMAATGSEHVIQGRVEVLNGEHFKLISVTEVKGTGV